MKMNNKILVVAISIFLIIVLSFSSFASSSYGDLFKGFGNALGGLAQSSGTSEKEAKAYGDLMGSLGSMLDTAVELSKTTVVEDLQEYEESIDDFIKYLDNIETKMKEQETTQAEKEKIANVLKRIFGKMKTLVDNNYK